MKPKESPLDRFNVSLRVDTFSTAEEKRDAVLRRVEYADKPGIVYAATHRNAETIAADLQQFGVEAVFYHGGLKAKEREEIQNHFMSGEVPVIVATNSFGIAFDKPDVRFVYHADVSESLDSYYQEIGLAGRDNKPAEAVLFYRPQDISSQQYKTGAGNIDTRALESVAQALAHHGRAASRDDLARETSLSARKLSIIVHKLTEVGAAWQLHSGKIKVAPGHSITEITEAAVLQQKQLQDVRKRRLEQMRSYAECRTCRRACLIRHFGADFSGPCGNCDSCERVGARPARVA